MPLVHVTLVEGVFTTEQKHEMAAAITDAMVKFEGSEAFREVVWVLIQELHKDGWHIGGLPFAGPATLMDALGRSKTAFEAIDGHPRTREELAVAAPVIKRDESDSYPGDRHRAEITTCTRASDASF